MYQFVVEINGVQIASDPEKIWHFINLQQMSLWI